MSLDEWLEEINTLRIELLNPPHRYRRMTEEDISEILKAMDELPYQLGTPAQVEDGEEMIRRVVVGASYDPWERRPEYSSWEMLLRHHNVMKFLALWAEQHAAYTTAARRRSRLRE